MDDHFLKKFRKNPRPEYARELYQRLNQSGSQRRFSLSIDPSKVLFKGVIAFSLVAVFTLMMLIPGALARSLGPNVHYLPGSTILRETDRLGSSLAYSVATPHGKVVSVQNLLDARRLAGFQFRVPSWLPENIVQEGTVRLAGVQDGKDIDRTAVPGKEIYIQPYAIGLTYRDTRSPRKIQLWVVRSDFWNDSLPPSEIGKGSYEDVKINELSGALVQGQWNSQSGRWNYYRGGFLLWVSGGLRYYLVTTGVPLAESDLLKMASSIK